MLYLRKSESKSPSQAVLGSGPPSRRQRRNQPLCRRFTPRRARRRLELKIVRSDILPGLNPQQAGQPAGSGGRGECRAPTAGTQCVVDMASNLAGGGTITLQHTLNIVGPVSVEGLTDDGIELNASELPSGDPAFTRSGSGTSYLVDFAIQNAASGAFVIQSGTADLEDNISQSQGQSGIVSVDAGATMIMLGGTFSNNTGSLLNATGASYVHVANVTCEDNDTGANNAFNVQLTGANQTAVFFTDTFVATSGTGSVISLTSNTPGDVVLLTGDTFSGGMETGVTLQGTDTFALSSCTWIGNYGSCLNATGTDGIGSVR